MCTANDESAPVIDCVCAMVYPAHFPECIFDLPVHPNDFLVETIAVSISLLRIPRDDAGVSAPIPEDSPNGLV